MNLYRNFTSQKEIDLEYNFALTVPEVGDWADFYTKHSAAARSNLDCALDVRYGPTVDETVDIFPAKEPGAPLLVFIHGGYWYSFSSKEFSMVANGLGGDLLIQEGKHHYSAIEGLNDGDSTLCKAVTDFMARCE
jgi:arylformamidase